MKKHGYFWEINGDMLKTDTFTLSMNSITSVAVTYRWWGILSLFIAVISIGIFIYSLFLETTLKDILVLGILSSFIFPLSEQLIIVSDGKKYKVNKKILEGMDDIEYLKDAIEKYMKEKA